MFKHYIDISDVVSLLVHCPAEKSFLLTKESSGEYWIPSFKAEKNSWKKTAQKMNFELFGMDAGYNCQPIRVYKVWLPNHRLACVHHVVYKVIVKPEIKKRAKLKAFRTRLLWMTAMELERQRAHTTLRSPEVCVFTQIVTGVDYSRETQVQEMETGILIEICEENVIVGDDAGGGAVSVATPNCALLHAANYSREDQARLYREFLVMVFPALYMSPFVFTQFMVELGWQRAACLSLFRAADVTGRGGLSFMEMMLWAAALEPSTPHNGIPAEIRCRYIFRFFDSNRDMKLEYVEFKELVAAVRAARQLAVDALSVARDADVCQVLLCFFSAVVDPEKQLGLQPNMQLPLAEFLRCVDELRLRGTSSLLRSPKSISGYLIDLQGRDAEFTQSTSSKLLSVAFAPTTSSLSETTRLYSASGRPAEFNIATYTVKLRKRAPVEMCELANYDDEAVSQSTARILAKGPSMEVLSLKSNPAEALSAVHLFAAAIERNKRDSIASKPAWSWSAPSDESNLGSLLLKLANAVRQLCMDEPRMLRVSSPVYAIGDLHGNLEALLAMESVLWPTGPALAPARLLFLGDFVDRGPHGAELMAYLLAAKLQRPAGVLLVRGNHETRDIQKMFTFYNECVAKYGDTEGPRVWNAINMVFDVLPLAAVVDDKIFCCHGGIPPPWVCPVISAINKVPMPLPRPAEQSSIAWELLWNDPINPSKVTATQQLELSANEGFAANSKRGTGHVFDQTALDRFLLANQLTHVLRAHQLHLNGFMCQLRGRLVSVFSSSHYCGSNNEAGVALIDGGKLRLMKLCDE